MAGAAVVLLILVACIAVAFQAALLHRSVSIVGGQELRDRNSFLTAFLLVILFSVVGFGLRVLLSEHMLTIQWALGASIAAAILTMTLSYGIGPMHALLILIVNGVITVVVCFGLAFFFSLLGTFVSLGRVFGGGGIFGGAGQ